MADETQKSTHELAAGHSRNRINHLEALVKLNTVRIKLVTEYTEELEALIRSLRSEIKDLKTKLARRNTSDRYHHKF